MKKSTKIILSIIGLGVITAGIILYVATRKPATSQDSAPIAEFEAATLIQQFNTDSATLKKIMDKNIAVKGTIKEIQSKDFSIILDAGEAASVICSFDSTAFNSCQQQFKQGQPAIIKGIFYGFTKTEDDGMGLIPAEKMANLKTCFTHSNQ